MGRATVFVVGLVMFLIGLTLAIASGVGPGTSWLRQGANYVGGADQTHEVIKAKRFMLVDADDNVRAVLMLRKGTGDRKELGDMATLILASPDGKSEVSLEAQTGWATVSAHAGDRQGAMLMSNDAGQIYVMHQGKVVWSHDGK